MTLNHALRVAALRRIRARLALSRRLVDQRTREARTHERAQILVTEMIRSLESERAFTDAPPLTGIQALT